MEIRIVITDAGAAGAKGTAVSVGQGSEGGVSAASSPAAAFSSGGFQPTAQDRANAIDAGPAPAGAGASAAPQPFIAQRAANVLGDASGAVPTDQAGGAAPGSGAGMETSTQETQHG